MTMRTRAGSPVPRVDADRGLSEVSTSTPVAIAAALACVVACALLMAAAGEAPPLRFRSPDREGQGRLRHLRRSLASDNLAQSEYDAMAS